MNDTPPPLLPCCLPVPLRQVKAPLEESAGKVNVLLQSYIGGARPASFTLSSDTNYVAQNAGRVSRAIFEISLRKGWCSLALTMLEISKAVDRRVWYAVFFLIGGVGRGGQH